MSFVREDIINTGKEFSIDMDNKTYGEIHNELLALIPGLHSREQLQAFALELTNKLIDEYGFYAYRVFASHPLIRTKGYNGFDEVDLYEHIHDAMGCSTKAFCTMNLIIHKIDLAILEHEFKDIYENEYGFLSMFVGKGEDLAHIMEMVHRHHFDPEYIKVIETDIQHALIKAGDNYFYKQDLTNKETIKKLYRIVGERYGLNGFRFDVFHDYDGYGHVIFKGE